MSPEQINFIDSNDPILKHFLTLDDRQEVEEEREKLWRDNIQPMIERVMADRLSYSARYTRPAEQNDYEAARDVQGQVVIQIFERLDTLRNTLYSGDWTSDTPKQPIVNFLAYCGVAAANAWNGYLSRKNPERLRLENRLRYALRHDRTLSLWQMNGVWYCGRIGWKEKLPPTQIEWIGLSSADIQLIISQETKDALIFLLDRAEAPVRFRDTLNFFVEHATSHVPSIQTILGVSWDEQLVD